MFERIKEIIANRLEIDSSEITEETPFVELGADSLDIFELAMDVESEYDIEIPSEVLEEFDTVGDVIEYLNENGIEE